MAASLARRASSDLTQTLFRRSVSFLRSFSTTDVPASSQNPNSSSSYAFPVVKRPAKKRGMNLYDVARYLPNWGLGYHFAKKHWKGVSYELTKINLKKSGRFGKAWGIVHREGRPPAVAPMKITGTRKLCWKYIKNVKKSIQSAPNLEKSSEVDQSSEVLHNDQSTNAPKGEQSTEVPAA